MNYQDLVITALAESESELAATAASWRELAIASMAMNRELVLEVERQRRQLAHQREQLRARHLRTEAA